MGVQELSNKRSEALKIVFFMILEGKKKEKLLYSENNFSFYYIISYRAAKKQKFGKHTDMVGKHHLNSHKPKRIDKGDDQQAGNQSQSDKHTFGQVHNAGGIRRYAAVVLKDIELLKQRSGHQNN